MNSKDIVTIAFIFTDKGTKLSEVKVIRPGRNNKGKARLLSQLNVKNIHVDYKFRMVDVHFGDYIKREQIDSHIEAIRKYYKERYKHKRYDSPKRWYQTRGVESLLEQEKEQFVTRIHGFKREQAINSLLKD